MRKSRLQKILELIDRERIGTQEELVTRLEEEGYHVTQATISRDIKQLGLMKVTGTDGAQFYRRMEEDEHTYSRKYVRVLREGLLSMEAAENILVIHTMTGMANAVGAALDQLRFDKVVGTVAGDDTILCVVKSREDAEMVLRTIEDVLKQE